jgi:putative hydrolase of the HAD superfamily
MAETVTDSQLDTAMASVFTPIQDTIELLERLREETHFRLVALTNSEPVRVRWHEEHGYRQLFDHYLVSCETRCAVPDPRMFKLALEAAEVQPEEVIFVGDVKKNVAAAQVFGFTAHVFQGAHAFRTFLHTQHVNA